MQHILTTDEVGFHSAETISVELVNRDYYQLSTLC